LTREIQIIEITTRLTRILGVASSPDMLNKFRASSICIYEYIQPIELAVATA
jgi:hypothetical protein